MACSSRRGRPKQQRMERDKGTPELQQKRKEGATLEPLDYCLQRGIISEDEHRAALHLRWLYTLKFGAPTVKGVELDNISAGCSHAQHDENWKAAREAEYRWLIAGLRSFSADDVVLDVAVFHRWHRFIVSPLNSPVRERFLDGVAWLVKQEEKARRRRV